MALIALPDEKQVFQRIAAGDAKAFRALFEHYREGIYGFVVRMIKSEETAEEIVQEVFLSIWTKRAGLKEIENPAGWIFTLARNRTLNELKKIANDEKLRRHLWQQLCDVQNTTEDQLRFRESSRLVEEAIEQLSPQKQRIFRMSRDQGLSHDQIAEALRLSKSTVKNNLVETLKWLRSRLKDQGVIVACLLMLEEFYK